MPDGYRTNGSTTDERDAASMSEHDREPELDVGTPAEGTTAPHREVPPSPDGGPRDGDGGRHPSRPDEGAEAGAAAVTSGPTEVRGDALAGQEAGSSESGEQAAADEGVPVAADAAASPTTGPSPGPGPENEGEGEGEGDPGDRFREAAKRAIEAMVMVAEEPMPPHLLAQLLEISPVVVESLCRELADSYEADDRGFQLVRVAGGWRYQSHPDQAAYVERLVLEGQTAKLSAAALETLAIVAYKQPISRAQVAAIRGVGVDGVMRTLQQRGFIVEVGKDPGPGQAVMFGTSASFLVKLGLNNLDELPPLGDFVPSADVVEQLERGLRPDRQPLRPEDAFGPPANGAGPSGPPDDTDGAIG